MQKIENSDPSSRCAAHRDQFTPAAHNSQAMSPNTRASRFTPDMIRDQEMLVSSMAQQGIPEDLIRRQFERLLEEQSKQLRFIRNEPVANKADPENLAEPKKCDSNSESYKIPPDGSFAAAAYNNQPSNQFVNGTEVCKESPCQEAANQHLHPPDTDEKSGKTQAVTNNSEDHSPPKVEPSSLLKIRLMKESLIAQKRNNGLQEAATALKIVRDSKSKIAQDRLSAEMEGMRLNGTQERTSQEQMQFNYIDGASGHNKMEKITAANGLENSRNPDNPAFRRYHPAGFTGTPSSMSYPQAHLTPTSGEPHTHLNSASTAATAHHQSSSQQISDSHNQQNAYSELQEPKVIGGFTYFARKPHCIPKMSGFSFDHSNRQISSQPNPRTALPISH